MINKTPKRGIIPAQSRDNGQRKTIYLNYVLLNNPLKVFIYTTNIIMFS